MAMLPWWIHYPNVNNEIINLDWILQISNENTDKIENFIGVNTIKYADPILWDITSQYEANTIVVDSRTGDAYISTKAVPYGVALSNDTYWTRIYNYAAEIHTFREQIAADEQLSTTATAPRSVDDLVFLNGLLYIVTNPMIAGDSYIEGSNCAKTTINAQLLSLHSLINAEAQAREDADDQLQGDIDANSNKIGTLSDLSTDEKSDLVHAINEVDAHADANRDRIGHLPDLSTDDKSDLVHAINEVDAHADANRDRIGHLPDLSTDDKSDLVHAINEVNSKSLMTLKDKKILILGDSISATDNTIEGCQPVWSTQFAEKLNTIATVVNKSQSGRKMIELPNIISNLNITMDFDIVIVFLGVNDFSNNVPMGNYGTNYNTHFSDAVRESYERINNQVKLETGHYPEIYFITPLYSSNANINTLGYPLWFYNSSITGFCKRWAIKWINGFDFPISNEIYHSDTLVDGLHPNSHYAGIMADYILNKLCGGGDSSSYNNDALYVSLNNKLSSGIVGNLMAFIENERLHIRGRIRLTPTDTNQVIATGMSNFISQIIFDTPYVECATFGATNGNISGLVYMNGSGDLYVNCSWPTLEETAIDFDYIVQPVWNNFSKIQA